MKAGDRVSLRGRIATRTGEIVLASANQDSFMIALHGLMPTLSGGGYVNSMAVLRTGGVYRDLIFGEDIDITVLREPLPKGSRADE